MRYRNPKTIYNNDTNNVNHIEKLEDQIKAQTLQIVQLEEQILEIKDNIFQISKNKDQLAQ